MECKIVDCHNVIHNKALSLCRRHYEDQRAVKRLETMRVAPCMGGCGKRVHNLRYIIVPGVIQGHGPSSVWCSGCVRKHHPEPVSQPRGNCKRCGKLMGTTSNGVGEVVHRAKGYCNYCYTARNRLKHDTKGENNGNAKLTPAIVRDIRERVAAGDTRRDVGRHYHIDPQTVTRIVNKQTWKHVD